MYVTKFELDPRNESVRRAISNVHDLHRDIMSAFAEPEITGDLRGQKQVLFKLVKAPRAYTLYIQSAELPNKAAMACRGYQYRGGRNLDDIRHVIREGAILGFTLDTLPSRKKVTPGYKPNNKFANSKRVFISDPQKRLEWLKARGLNNGFEVLDAYEKKQEEDVSVDKKTGDFKFKHFTYGGRIKITDANAFWECLKVGIGPEKAYGLGMIMLGRA